MGIEVRAVSRKADGSFYCEVNHPTFGWVPYGASADDVEPYGRAVHAECVRVDNAAQSPQ